MRKAPEESTNDVRAFRKRSLCVNFEFAWCMLAAAMSPSAHRVRRPLPRTSRPSILISHPDKIFWPEEGYTKQDLTNFYETVFRKLQPYVRDRIPSLERCPDGICGQCFYQKEAPDGLPSGTRSKRVAHVGDSGKSTRYVVAGSLATQIALVNLGCIAVHVSNSRVSALRKPDWVCFDLDPESGRFSDAAKAAFHLRDALEALELEAFPKTSGGRGIHLFIPLRPGPTTDEVLSFARSVCARVAAAHPKETTVEHSIAKRSGRVYLDPFRNGFLQTVAAPYSVRRRPHAPISTPLAWSEVQTSLDPSDFNLGNFVARLKCPDPWIDFFKSRQSLTQAIKSLRRL